MESQPQNLEFRNNPENFHPCYKQNMQINFIQNSVNYFVNLSVGPVHTSLFLIEPADMDHPLFFITTIYQY